MDLNNKGKHYVKLYRDTKSSNIYALSAEVESHEEVDVDVENLLNSPGTEFVLEKNLENDIVPEEQSNNALISEVITDFVKDTGSGVSDGDWNVKPQQEIRKKGKYKGKEKKTKKKKDIEFKWSKRHTRN